MKRVSLVLFVCALVVGASFFFSRERNLVRNEPRSEASKIGPSDPDRALSPDAISGIAKSPGGRAETAASPDTRVDVEKVRVLDEILHSKNDNDPRLDRDFNALTPGAKALFRARYSSFAPERRNERGTIVFLLGRNLTSESDLEFLHQVIGEPPCRSLADCSSDPAGSTPSESLHHEMGDGVTLAYPQLVALTSLERYLWSPSQDPTVTASALRELEAARRSPVAKVAELASEITHRYARRSSRH